MKQKILLLALICLTSLTDVFSQCATTIIASGGTSGTARCPMTRYRNARSHYLITAAEMTAAGFGPGNSIDGISWNYATAPTISGIGNLKVYLENTADVANIKGNNFATAIVPMTMAHSAPVTLPAAAGFFNITFSGGTPFTYSGGGVYVAFDWDYCAGTLDAVGVVSCNTALASGLQGLQNAGACAVLTGLAASAFRPDTRFISTVVNDVKADYIYTIGEMPLTFAPNHVVQARVVNRSNTVFTNYNVNLDILGANSFSNVQTIGTLGACATATVTFPPFTPASIGIDTVRITLPADNNNANNKKDVLQTVSNNRYSYRYGGEAPVTGVGVNAATGVISARFATNTPLTLTDVNVQFNSTGQPYKIAIYPDNLGTPALVPLYIDATDRITTNLPAADQTLTTPVTVPAGNFYVTIHQTGLTNMGVIYAAEAPLRTGTFHYASPAPPASWLDLAPANGFRTLLGVKFCFPFSPDTILGPTTVCANSTNTYSVTPIQDAISYTWTLPGGWAGVSFTNSINAFAGLTGGNITCVANFSCGPSVAKTLTVNISNPTFSSVTPANVSCNGAGNGQIVVTSAAASPVFSINPLATQSPAGTFINLSPATYTITLTDASGCSNTTSVSITEPLVLNATAASTAVCTGALSTLTATGSGGTGPYTYQWIDGIVTNTITINPMKDNTIYEESPSNSNATGPNMVAGNNGVGFKGRALMAFDIAGNVPAGATINTASLQLNCSLTNGGAGAQTHFLHKLSADWGEGTSFAFGAGAGASATPNDATWNTRFFPGTNWITAGGDFNAVATASTVVDATGLYTWTSAQMAADVQNWVNTPATNFGWLLKGIESAPTQAKRYDSRENGNAGNRPQLTINYSMPNVVGNTATLNNMPAGTYTVIVTYANGCTSTSVTSVTVNPLPTVTASPVTQTVCENGMATISGGGAATYTWTGGITDATPFMVVAAGNYTVTGTDANGCSNTATAEVLMNAAPVITAGATPNTTCDQTTVTPSASGAGTIVWSGGLTNNVPFVA
ncbi:MAG: DNRLRE domain-containing protein, partial [Chitinophagaceae bacterium]|nr:DNRLRE domain-containing protein [Chitinophagaceae bacterium]